MKNLKTQGFIALDVDVAALNNAGKSTSSQFDNAVATKKIRKGNENYTYVSGQAWRFWWRNTLAKSLDWSLSPITRDKSIAFTAANPLAYPDDDIFGYMRAAKEEVIDKKGKAKMQNVTVTRVSPLKNSAIISVSATSVASHWSSMARQEGDAVPYAKEEYSAIMKGMFSLDLEQVGTFANYNKTGFKNLTDQLADEIAEKEGITQVNDSHVKDSKGEAQKLLRLAKKTRIKRATDTIAALKTISGGAMQTNNLADVTPKFIILSTMSSGNHPFSHVFVAKGAYKQVPQFNLEGLKEVVEDYQEQFEGKIFIGIRSGFLDDEDKKALEEYASVTPQIELSSVNKAIDGYCATIESIL
jgi:CRISPR-associated protein Cst2